MRVRVTLSRACAYCSILLSFVIYGFFLSKSIVFTYVKIVYIIFSNSINIISYLCNRALNGSRIIRRMRVTGFRMINISCRSTGYDVVTDSYVRGIDEACVDGTGRNFLCAFWHFLEVSCPSIETRGNDASSHRSTMYIVHCASSDAGDSSDGRSRMDGHGSHAFVAI